MPSAQEYASYEIDTTSLPVAKRLYVRDLNLRELENGAEIELRWKAHRNIHYFMIEVRDEQSDSLLYRQQHNGRSAIFPKQGKFTVLPLTKHRQGIPLSISLSEARERNFAPKNTAINLEIKRTKKKQDSIFQEHEKLRNAEQQKQERTHNFFSTARGIITFIIFGVLASVVVLIIYFIQKRKEKPVTSDYNREFDKDFENRP